jgi:hypothetical protein
MHAELDMQHHSAFTCASAPYAYSLRAVLCYAAGENSGEANAAAEAAQEASRKAAIAAGLLPDAAGGEAEEAEAARVRRLKAQGRFMPY